MSITSILQLHNRFNWELCARQIFFLMTRNYKKPSTESPTDEEGFRILDLKTTKSRPPARRKRETQPAAPPRTSRMALDQKWSDVWPGPRTFHPASVPLPLRQGVNKLGASPDKWGNAELMKIPNFLHLTPPAVEGHCKAIKKFCTRWPNNLTDEKIKELFPFETVSTDYCHSSPTIRDPLSRIITIKFPLSCLEFDRHARDKFLRLVGERYDEETDLVTIVTDKCPLKQQNYDYALYLLTALYHESWITEPWENERTVEDMEYYDWDNSNSKANVECLLTQTKDLTVDSPEIEKYKSAVVTLFDEGENDYNWNQYQEASANILFPSHSVDG